MMTQAFYTGLSGLKANQIAIDVVSDNLSNINTPGYRGYTSEFKSMFEERINASSTGPVDSTIGIGVEVSSTVMNQAQGSLLLSDISTDLAIDGDGWFGLSGNSEGNTYTRAGNFTFDANNDLITADDAYYVLGTMGNNIEDGVLTEDIFDLPLSGVDEQERLRFPKTLTYPPEPTDEASFFGNLGTDDVPTVVSASVVDPQNSKNQLKLVFTKSAVQNALGTRWDVQATTQTLDGNTIYDNQTGIVEFNERGALDFSTLGSIDNNGIEVAINLGSGFTGITAMDNRPVSVSSSSNGTIGGDLLGYEINQDAEVLATFSNGMQSTVGKIALFHFQNDQGLLRETGTRFKVSANSGEAIFFKDENGQNILGANVVNFKIEDSNVKMEAGLTELIILQRSYDANSKSITTADQMMQKALEMDA